MHVQIVSACTGASSKRTKSVLDRFAIRTSRRTWSLDVTAEGLDTIKARLRRSATRATAVGCFRNARGGGFDELVWIVGNPRPFDRSGAHAVWTTEGATRERTVDRAEEPDVEPWIHAGQVLARAAGLTHDLGKNNGFFAKKILAKKPLADPVRHELLSFEIVRRALAQERTNLSELLTESARDLFGRIDDSGEPVVFHEGAKAVETPESALLACVATHHRLFSEGAGARAINSDTFKNGASQASDRKAIKPELFKEIKEPFPGELEEEVGEAIRAAHCLDGDSTYWKALTILVRIALIMADVSVSKRQQDEPDRYKVYANSRMDETTGRRVNSQSLIWHLRTVAAEAEANLERFSRMGEHLPWLEDVSGTTLDAPATGGFAWQNDAVEAARHAREEHPATPMLLAVTAGTGSGKTRACAKMAWAGAIAGRLRVATLLNLRTLTLQTGDAYARQIGLDQDDLAVVIGDSNVQKAYGEGDERALGEDDTLDIDMPRYTPRQVPAWLRSLVADDERVIDMLAAPVLVTTADYLVPGADLGRGVRHGLPLLRLMTSDLILDEIDNYDSTSVIAILRLVQMAGLFGRNVIASSATLPRVLAQKLGDFYADGARLRGALKGEDAPFLSGVFSDTADPIVSEGSEDAFVAAYDRSTQSTVTTLAKRAEEGGALRRGEIVENAPEDKMEGVIDAIANTVLRMHERHSWQDPRSGKPVSIGLVRVATIGTALQVADALCGRLGSLQPKVACYHSALFHGHRLYVETALDGILTRTLDGNAPSASVHIRRHLDSPVVREGLFIVVATPVEEVGRDHDFDWAVVEPSSAQSIVQVAGRVRRHRHNAVVKPNVGVLRYNVRACRGENVAFTRPGNETAEAVYPHDVAELLVWPEIRKALDARIRFQPEIHEMSRLDDEAIERAFQAPWKRATDVNRPLWLSSRTYQAWSLRGASLSQRYRLNRRAGRYEVFQKTPRGAEFVEVPLAEDLNERPEHWLCPPDLDIESLCEQRGVPAAWGFEFNVLVYPDRHGDTYLNGVVRHSYGFRWSAP